MWMLILLIFFRRGCNHFMIKFSKKLNKMSNISVTDIKHMSFNVKVTFSAYYTCI